MYRAMTVRGVEPPSPPPLPTLHEQLGIPNSLKKRTHKNDKIQAGIEPGSSECWSDALAN